MKKVLIVFCGALVAICLLNVKVATNKVAKSTTVSISKALADGENDPAPYPSNNPDDYVDNPNTGNSSLDDPIVLDPIGAQPGPPSKVPIN
jgi:hypothetical protein